jgi:hypothetical protein
MTLRHTRSHNSQTSRPIYSCQYGCTRKVHPKTCAAPELRRLKVDRPKQNNKRVNLISNLGKIARIGIGKTAFARLSCILSSLSGRRGKTHSLGPPRPVLMKSPPALLREPEEDEEPCESSRSLSASLNLGVEHSIQPSCHVCVGRWVSLAEKPCQLHAMAVAVPCPGLRHTQRKHVHCRGCSNGRRWTRRSAVATS